MDRIDGTKGYFKDNCRWIPQKDQNRNNSANRLITLDGVTKCVGEWSEETGLNEATIRRRLNSGWGDMFTLRVPIQTPRLHKADGEWKTLREWSLLSGKTISILKQRLKRGWSLEDAIHQPVHTKFASFRRAA